MNCRVMSFGKLLILKITFLAVISPLVLTAGPNFDPFTDQEIEDRVTNLNTVISVKYTERVRQAVYYYAKKHKKSRPEDLLSFYMIYFKFYLATNNFCVK